MKFEESIFINRPVEEVFAYVTDYSTHPLWADAVRVDILTPGPQDAPHGAEKAEGFVGSRALIAELPTSRKVGDSARQQTISK